MYLFYLGFFIRVALYLLIWAIEVNSYWVFLLLGCVLSLL